MTAPDSSVSPSQAPFPEETVEAGFYLTPQDGFQHSLVVLAMGEACWLIPTEGGHQLRVEPATLNSVRQQLSSFDQESVGWPPLPIVDSAPVRTLLPLSPLAWVLAVVGVFRAQGQHAELTAAGRLDGRRVFESGEWWRAASALWLHADLSHLVSNAGSGLLVFSAVVSTFGLKTGWGLIAIAAIAGNLAVAALHYGEDYLSLGASTAIFAGLGLLVGRAIRVISQSRHPHRWRSMLIPLGAGLAVLGLYGAGGVNIDVLAHATGFSAGLALGFVAGTIRAQPTSSSTGN